MPARPRPRRNMRNFFRRKKAPKQPKRAPRRAPSGTPHGRLRSKRTSLPPEAKVAWSKAGSSALRAAAYGGVGILAAKAAQPLVDSVTDLARGREDNIEDYTKEIPGMGIIVLGKDGETKFLPYPGAYEGDNVPPPTEVTDEENPVKAGFESLVSTLFSPITILAVAAGLALLFYFKNKKGGK